MSDYQLNRVLYEKARAHKMVDSIGPDELADYELTAEEGEPSPSEPVGAVSGTGGRFCSSSISSALRLAAAAESSASIRRPRASSSSCSSRLRNG